jgi:hypothetical protein
MMHIYVYFFSLVIFVLQIPEQVFSGSLNGTWQLDHGMLSYGKLKLFHCPLIPVKSLQGVVVKVSIFKKIGSSEHHELIYKK